MKSIHIAVVMLSAALLVTACSSKSKTTKAATGKPKPTTTQPATTPKPSKKAAPNVAVNKPAATPVTSEPDCTVEQEGLAECAGTFVVFCSGTKIYAIDCAEGFGGTCGEIDGAVDCVIEVEE